MNERDAGTRRHAGAAARRRGEGTTGQALLYPADWVVIAYVIVIAALTTPSSTLTVTSPRALFDDCTVSNPPRTRLRLALSF